ncbi:hypothetical protein ACFO3J_12735 [Streptomyces polygonati]|uniref:Secreted protein n=1 Tax=Streptomyces polygonati TaxID=1617087 RepID=A0ABV8HK21_9ACTN
MIRAFGHRVRRGIAVGAVSAALLAGGGVGAAATAHATAGPAAHHNAQAATNNLQVTPIRIQVGKNVTYSGSTSGLTTGTTVQLQQLIGGTWQNVAGKTVKTKANGTYGPLLDSFRYTGEKTMRTNAGGVLSNQVHLTVVN